MLLNIDPIKSAGVSLIGAIIGTISDKLPFIFIELPIPVDVVLERMAWTVAVVAGLISAWNGLMSARERYRKNHIKSKLNEKN